METETERERKTWGEGVGKEGESREGVRDREVGEGSRGWERDFNMGRELYLKFYRSFNSVKLRSTLNDLAVWPVSIRSYPY